MGSNRSTYFGIYLEIPHEKTQYKETIWVNPVTRKKQKTRFNAETGVENESVVITTTSIYSASCVDDDSLNEYEFFIPAYTHQDNRKSTLLLNSRSKYNVSVNEESFNLDVSKLNPMELIQEFEIEKKAYLDYYRAKHETVSVKYGMVIYIH